MGIKRFLFAAISALMFGIAASAQTQFEKTFEKGGVQCRITKVERKGEDAVISLTVKNLKSDRRKFQVFKNYGCDNKDQTTFIYDSEGYQYPIYRVLNGGNTYPVNMPSNVPVKVEIIVEKVPVALKSFRLILPVIEVNNDPDAIISDQKQCYYPRFYDVPIPYER